MKHFRTAAVAEGGREGIIRPEEREIFPFFCFFENKPLRLLENRSLSALVLGIDIGAFIKEE